MFTQQELLKQLPSLFKFAMKLTRNLENAEDLVQNTVVAALSKNAQFEQGTNLFSWMSRILFNSFVSDYRQSSHYETRYDPQVYIDQQVVEATQDNEMDLDLVTQAMTALSEDHREILRLVCIDGMKYAEVAEMLQIPVGTVRSRLSRAREGLQEQLKLGRANRPVQIPVSTAIAQKIVIKNEASVTAIPELMSRVAANQSREVNPDQIPRWGV